MRNAADFLLGYFFILLIVLVCFEVLVLFISIPEKSAAQVIIFITTAVVILGASIAIRPKLVTIGFYSHGTSTLYLSEGTRTWGPMIRLGTRSEITIFEISNES